MTCERLYDEIDNSIWGPAPFVCEYADILERQAQFRDTINQCKHWWHGPDIWLGVWLASPEPMLAGHTPLEYIDRGWSFRVIELLQREWERIVYA